MRVVIKRRLRFHVFDAGHAVPAIVDVLASPDPFGGWTTRAVRRANLSDAAIPLNRGFRSSELRLAVDKMVVWVRRRFNDVRPVPLRRGAGD